MPLFTPEDIQKLERYYVTIMNMTVDFYDERMQPREDIKEEQRERYPFYDVRTGLDKCAYTITGDLDMLAENIHQAGYDRLAPYRHGSTGMTCIVENAQQDWALVRGWQKGRSFNYLPDKNNFNMQPDIVFPKDEKPSAWIAPFMLVTQLTYGRPALREVHDIFNKFTANCSMNVIDLEDMGYYRDGRFCFVDPGHARRKQSFLDEAAGGEKPYEKACPETVEKYMDALSNRPHLANLFDYRENPQQKFFPRNL